MFALEYLVGVRFGLWARGLCRYPNQSQAALAAHQLRNAEHKCGATYLKTRVVAL